MKILQDIYILTSSGVVLFNRVFDPQIKTQLFGALMSALNSFAENLAEGGLSNFELSDKRFIIMKKNDFLYVANSSTKVKPKRVIEQLELVAKKFFELYPLEWFKNDWNNEVSIFEEFEKEIHDLMEDPVKSFWDSF